jgi:hypothetical protein
VGYSWLSVHRVRFLQSRSAAIDGVPGAPENAAAWRFGPHAPLGEDGLRTGVSDVWGGVGFYHSQQAAEAVVGDPSAHLNFLGETAENWHALAAVIAHRGDVDWSTETEPHPALTPLGEDPGGTMAVITTAGYLRPAQDEMDRIKPFLRKVNEVVDWYQTLECNAAAMLFNAVESKQGMTFSVWKSDPGMLGSAYRNGKHSEFLKMHQSEPMFDMSSFTRLRLLASSGSWEGRDPRASAA